MIVQVPGEDGVPAGTMPPVNVTVRGAVETLPPQVVDTEPGTTVNTSPGNVSESSTPVYGERVGFRSVIVSVVVPPVWKLGGENDFDKAIA